MLKEKRISNNNRLRRLQRTRKKIAAYSTFPRLSVFRSLKHLYLQVIDDAQGKTLCSASDAEVTAKGKKPVEVAAEVGKLLAKKALEKKVGQVVFDKGSYKYHGQVKAAAEAAREGGLKF